MKFVTATAGNEKFRGDKRQFAGLLFVASVCALFFPMAGFVGAISPGSVPSQGIGLADFIARICVMLIGVSGMLTGYLELVHGYSNVLLTGWVIVIVQTAWLPYLTDMTNVGLMARDGMSNPAFGLGRDSFNATQADYNFFGAMGILGVFSYGACFLGSLAFMSFSLYAYQAGSPGDRAASYFRGRLRVYAFLVLVAGVAQLGLGAYTLSNFSAGPIGPTDTPLGVAMFTITYPEIAIFVGLVYVINGIWGMILGFTMPQDAMYQRAIALQWLLTVALTILTQIGYLDEATQNAAAPSRSCLMLGAHIMPAFLDYKARATPEVLDDDYYGDLGMPGEEAPLTRGDEVEEAAEVPKTDGLVEEVDVERGD